MGNLHEPYLDSWDLFDAWISSKEFLESIHYEENPAKLPPFLQEMEPLTARFNKDVFFGAGLGKAIAAAPTRNLTGRFGAVTLNSFTMCGRTKMTLHGKYDEDAIITFSANEKGKTPAGLDSFQGRRSDLERLVSHAARGLKSRQWAKMLSMEHKTLYLVGSWSDGTPGCVPVGYE